MSYDPTIHAGVDTQAAVDAGLALAEPRRIEDTHDPHVIVVPAGGRHEVLDLERFSDAPRRAAGKYSTATVEAFVAFVSRHDSDSGTTVWVHPTDGTVVAVINDHDPAGADWRDFRVSLDLRATDEWRHWIERDGVLGGQEDFAEHIEDGLTEIAEPSGAELLEIAQTFHATTSANFRQAIRLQDGRSQFRYDEEIDARAGTQGELVVPQEITLVLAPYVGEPEVQLLARLRYRVSGGNLKIGYKLDRPERVKRDALEAIAERITGAFPARVFLGAPPA